MNVSPEQPFQIIYSLFAHQYLGYQMESFIVQLDDKGEMTLKYQNISSLNAKEFAKGLDGEDYELIRLMDSMQQDAVVRKYGGKKNGIADFFLKTYDPKSGNTELQKTIQSDLERKRARILELMVRKPFYEMASDGHPASRQIIVEPVKASVLFHFRRNAENTHYFITLKHQGQKLEFQYRNAYLVCKQPAWLMLNQRLYHFEKEVDGNKIQPFLKKNYIEVPRRFEDEYYNNFVSNVVKDFDVYAKGFQIQGLYTEARPEINLYELPRATQANLFAGQQATGTDNEGKIVLDLHFHYDRFAFHAQEMEPCSVKIEKQGNDYVFYRISRQTEREKEFLQILSSRGLEMKLGKASLNKTLAFEWLNQWREHLEAQGFRFKLATKDSKVYFMGKSVMGLEVSENRDWFDIKATVQFGPYTIPFAKIRKMIVAGQHEFALPNGEIAVIPQSWFTQYAELMNFVEENEHGIIIKKHHLALLQELHDKQHAQLHSPQVAQVQHADLIADFALPADFRGELRPYQKVGYNWMRFLQQHRLGGCLADDMGLGKTVQTLALLQAEKERLAQEGAPHAASLLVMPTSLLYNWEMEARKFAPKLRVMVYTGTNRLKKASIFDKADVVLTSYGIVRLDIDEVFGQYKFNYLILDESQAIKNPDSNIAKAVRQLAANHRLVLTGTPIENNTMDLWSQMSFVNPGLLGSQTFFQRNFQTPIEKKNDKEKLSRLQTIIKPFILRRHKSQVATDLPEKVESIYYVSMTDAQAEEYERVKSHYRNTILQHIEQEGLQKSHLLVLQGLTKLRQIANHPAMTDSAYTADSGKLRDVLHMIETAISENHKILIFSQFVKHLELVKNALIERGLAFAYLDGSTKDRQAQVERFQRDQEVRLFLISIKAGGTGLNLTAADYVFLLDPWWNPAVEAQAIDRAHRIGQENKVMIYKFITQNTVEEKIIRLQQSKLHLATELISSTEDNLVKHLSKDDIAQLLS